MVTRVALTGAQGTGKSTLACAIADCLRSEGRAVALYTGLGDEVTAAGLATGAAARAASVRAFVQLHLAREDEDTGAIQVFDRCLLDALAYAHVLGCLPTAEVEALRRATVASCERLGRLIWLRVTTDYPVLTVGDESPDFRRAVDHAIGALARDNGIAVIEHAIPPEALMAIAASAAGAARENAEQ